MAKDLSFSTIKEQAGTQASQSLESLLERRVYNASDVQAWTG